jgi:hypothetical protein
MDAIGATVVELLRKSGLEIDSEVCGVSMSPTIAAGTRIRIRYGAARYQPGDIVAILAEPLIAHRVVRLEQRGSRRFLITRGDSTWFCDPPVAEDQIVGIVTAQHDGKEWRPPGARQQPRGWASMLAWLSEHGTRVALRVSESGAILMARGVSKIALLGRHYG